MENLRRVRLLVWGQRHKIARYLVSGGTAAAVNFFFLYVFTEFVGLYYLVSVVAAFLIAVVVSFLMQKFWTFRNNSKEDMHRQMAIYITVALINTVVNTALVYIFVEFIHLHYLVGQLLASALIALESFFIYQRFIFKDEKEQVLEKPLS